MNEIGTRQLIHLWSLPLLAYLSSHAICLKLGVEMVDTLLKSNEDLAEVKPQASIHPLKPSSKPIKIIRE